MTAVDEAREAHAALADALMALRDKDPDALRLLLDTGSRDYAYAIAQRLVSASGVRTAAVRAERDGLVAALTTVQGALNRLWSNGPAIDTIATLGSSWVNPDGDPTLYEQLRDLSRAVDDALATPLAQEPEREGLARTKTEVALLGRLYRSVSAMGEDGECSVRHIRGTDYVTRDDVLLLIDDQLSFRKGVLALATPPAPEPER